MSQQQQIDRNSLAYWFPKIEAAGLPVPKTVIFEMSPEAEKAQWEMFDGGPRTAVWDVFVDQAKSAAAPIGYPLFLRSAHTSGKHEWANTCFVPSEEKLGAHISQIAYFSECVSMCGELPWTTWAFRELLPTEPIGNCSRYGGMPICKEFRFFVCDGKVVCWHPYWPEHSLVRGGAEISLAQYAELCDIEENLDELTALAERAGAAMGGAWSIDFLWTERGWFLTDMAIAERSWHWPGCASGVFPTPTPEGR